MGGRIGEIILLLIILLLLFGPDKLPKIGKALGDSLHEFKKASSPPTEDQNLTTASRTASVKIHRKSSARRRSKKTR
jgi:sec-independent protein translocase protein TatA